MYRKIGEKVQSEFYCKLHILVQVFKSNRRLLAPRPLIFLLILYLVFFTHFGALTADKAIKNEMVALFFVTQENLSFNVCCNQKPSQYKLRGEIYPVALINKDKYIDAIVFLDDDVKNMEESNLNKIRNFNIFIDGVKQGEFHVDEIILSNFSCSSICTGKGRLKGNSLKNIYELIGEKFSESESGFRGNESFEYTQKWTLAFTEGIKVHSSSIKAEEKDLYRYEKDLMTVGKPYFLKYKNDDKYPGNESEIELKFIDVRDIDHDGSPEIFGIMEKVIKKYGYYYDQNMKKIENSGHYNDYIVRLNLWFKYIEEKPVKMMETIKEVDMDRFQGGIDIIGTADLNNDGIEEVIVRVHGYESINFEIYQYKDNKMIMVFRSQAYGC